MGHVVQGGGGMGGFLDMQYTLLRSISTDRIYIPNIFRECTQPEGFFEGDNLKNVKNDKTPSLAPFIANGEAPFVASGEYPLAPLIANGEAPLAPFIAGGEAPLVPFLTAESL